VGGLVLVAPVFSARTVPVSVRTGLVLVLTALLGPLAAREAGAAPSITPATFVGETLIGFAIGLGAALLVGAVEAMGDLVSTSIGLQGAALFDPLNNSSTPVLGQFASLFAVTVLLSLDAHLVMLEALAESVRAVPVGATLDLAAGAGRLVALAGVLFSLGLRFAAPVIAAVLVTNVALAVLGRAAPQLNIISLAFPVQIGIGLVALIASLSFVATWLTGWTGPYAGVIGATFDALLPR
jgi:flagellar biosynthetic protein FliR